MQGIKVDTHENMKPKNLSQGEFYGYYEQRKRVDNYGNETLLFLKDGRPAPNYDTWITGQNGKNQLTPEEKELNDAWLSKSPLAQTFEVLLPSKGDDLLDKLNLGVVYLFFGFIIGVMIYQGMNM